MSLRRTRVEGLRSRLTPLCAQMHHLLNNGAEINQRDEKGWTPLHRAAYLAHFDGYLELYEYLLVRAAGHFAAACPLPCPSAGHHDYARRSSCTEPAHAPGAACRA